MPNLIEGVTTIDVGMRLAHFEALNKVSYLLKRGNYEKHTNKFRTETNRGL